MRSSRWREQTANDLGTAADECGSCVDDLIHLPRISAADRRTMYDRLERARAWIDDAMALLED